MAYPHKWSPISYKSSAGQRKHIGQRPMLYRWTTQPTGVLLTGGRKSGGFCPPDVDIAAYRHAAMLLSPAAARIHLY